MMWLSAQQTPDFRTINRFRSERMKDMIEPLFTELIKLLLEQKYITMENYFMYGTKIEANANKYTFVWKKATKKYEEKLQENLQKTFQLIEEMIELDEETLKEMKAPAERVSAKQLEKIAEKVEQKVKEAETDAEQEEDKQLNGRSRLGRTEQSKRGFRLEILYGNDTDNPNRTYLREVVVNSMRDLKRVEPEQVY